MGREISIQTDRAEDQCEIIVGDGTTYGKVNEWRVVLSMSDGVKRR